jgi:CheY-like chemotaxis protein
LPDKKRILIVDDNEDIRDLLALVLEEEGTYILSFAEDGEQAIAEALRVKPDLILLDMSLPRVSGWEVVTYLRRLPDFEQTPIIAITAHVSELDRNRILAMGCTRHLGKPFDLTTVLDTIADLLN